MVRFAVLRHAPTEWNAVGRVQGRTDIPLSEAGRKVARGWSIPVELAGFRLLASPLARTVETARILLGLDAQTDDRLIEMDWAVWEGRELPDLRAELGDLMIAWEARGLDFCAPGGESPRDVQVRLLTLLAEIAQSGESALAVTHKGVIRALYAFASGWDMTNKPPSKLHDNCIHIFALSADGRPRVERLNVPLAPEIAG
jgi:broad specificity phosphatase PhoE